MTQLSIFVCKILTHLIKLSKNPNFFNTTIINIISTESNAAAKSAPKRIPGILFLSVSYNTSEINLTVSPICLFLIKAFCSGPIILHKAFCILFANILLNIFKSTFNRPIGLQDLIKVWSFPGFELV